MKSSDVILLVVVIGAVAAVAYFATRKSAPIVTQPAAPQGPTLGQSIGGLIDAARPLVGGLL